MPKKPMVAEKNMKCPSCGGAMKNGKCTKCGRMEKTAGKKGKKSMPWSK